MCGVGFLKGMAVEPLRHLCTAFAVISERSWCHGVPLHLAVLWQACEPRGVMVARVCLLSDKQCTTCKHGYVGCRVTSVPAYCCVS